VAGGSGGDKERATRAVQHGGPLALVGLQHATIATTRINTDLTRMMTVLPNIPLHGCRSWAGLTARRESRLCGQVFKPKL
jgi:hypothetical protein